MIGLYCKLGSFELRVRWSPGWAARWGKYELLPPAPARELKQALFSRLRRQIAEQRAAAATQAGGPAVVEWKECNLN